jgi:hypothetical protein
MIRIVTFYPSRRLTLSAPNLCVDLPQVFTADVVWYLPINATLVSQLKKYVLV